jgi:hypothetical protein
MPESGFASQPSRKRVQQHHGVEWVISQMRHLDELTAAKNRTANNIASWLRDHRHDLIGPLLMAEGNDGKVVGAVLADHIKPLGFVSYVNGHYELNHRGQEVAEALRKQLRTSD